MNYHYFVSYFYLTDNNTTPSIGMSEIVGISKIKSYKDLEAITSGIAEKLKVEQVTILNYQLICEEPY